MLPCAEVLHVSHSDITLLHTLSCKDHPSVLRYLLNVKHLGRVVQVLGTLITEWDDGKAKCETFLKTEETAQQTARQLAAIAAYFGFDGWLLNIENSLDTELMPSLLFFIRCALRWRCYVLKQAVPLM